MEKIGRVTDKSVHKCTGKHWDEWLQILNKAGAKNWTHKEIVVFLKKKYKVSVWWQQVVTTCYEIAIGRRIEGQSKTGFQTTTTKSLNKDSKVVWKVLTSAPGIQIWLKPITEFDLKPKQAFETSHGYFGEVRTMKAGSKIRLSWQEEEWLKKTFVELLVVPRPKNKCILVITHGQLADGRTKTKMKTLWLEVVDELVQLISSQG